MFGLQQKHIDAINACFAQYPQIEQVILYGSRAKGNYKNGSDIDLTIVGDLDYNSLLKLENQLDDLLLPYKMDLSLKHKITNPDLLNHIERVGKVFYEKAIEKVLSKPDAAYGKPSEWKTYKLGELIHLVGGGTPKTTVPEYWNGEIPWLSVVDFGKGLKKVYQTEKSITEKGLNESSTKILKEGQIIISARGTVGELAVLGRDMAFNQSCYGIYANEKTENNFLYYLLKYSIVKIKKNTHGAVFDTITKQTFDNIEVSIPESKETQNQIAAILSSLDDKIALNLQMNQTLEAMAQAIFKEWFVNLNFPKSLNLDSFDLPDLHDLKNQDNQENPKNHSSDNGLPKGWRMGPIRELIDVQNGYAFKSGDFLEKGNNGVIKIKNISNNVVDIVNMQFVSDEVAKSIGSRFKVKSADLLIAMTGAEVGKVGIVPNTEKKLWLNQRVGSFKEKINYAKWFVYLILSTKEYQNVLLSSASGSAQPNISAAQIESVETLIPTHNFIENFGEIVNPIFEKILDNFKQNEVLTQLRDTLLPKLMSGQIKL
ncbi:MAG: restriction endonuclease subunit S [Rhodothermia bacterium]|nr:restriction endonuclease subunit S [Rhodothermia bacterium]